MDKPDNCIVVVFDGPVGVRDHPQRYAGGWKWKVENLNAGRCVLWQMRLKLDRNQDVCGQTFWRCGLMMFANNPASGKVQRGSCLCAVGFKER